ncbi:MAG: exonuclease domain-containing protein [Bacteroidota bacterium]
MKKKYAIIDIETTGGRASREKITEIAIILHDGEKIIDQWETLLNPERTIPYNITKITGINDEMVQDAPKFYEVAKKVVEMTEGAIFVAHNVRFDYGFIREEFRRLGFTFMRKQLCTVRLSRKAFPGLRSYALGNLIRHFGIKVNARHRAMADAAATTELLEMIFQKEKSEEQVLDMINLGVKESKLPINITMEKLHELPEETGVYYFHDRSGKIVYVGKSINIKKRVVEHFTAKTDKAYKLQKMVHDISYEITGSELVALLFESNEIKRYLPPINRAQRRRFFPYVIFEYENQEGYRCLSYAKINAKERKKINVLRELPNLNAARGLMRRLIARFELCQSLCGLDNTGGACFNYHLHKCRGACLQKEAPADYNERVEMVADAIKIDFEEDFLLVDIGRNNEEKSIILVEDGQYRGFGYVSLDELNDSVESLKDAIKPFRHHPETVRIIHSFLYKENSGLKRITIPSMED